MRPLSSLDLRPVGFNHVRVNFRRQWWLLSATASCDSASFAQSFTTSSSLFNTSSVPQESQPELGKRREKWRSDPKVDLESLNNTLEAHRSANRASLKGKKVADLSDQGAAFFRPVLEYVNLETPEAQEHDADQQRLQASVDGKDSKHPLQNPPKYPPSRSTSRSTISSAVVEYDGNVQRLKNSWKLPLHSSTLRNTRPWLVHLNPTRRRSQSVCDYLTAEILAFEQYIDPKASEKAAMHAAYSNVSKVIGSVNPAIKISMIGSQATGLATPLSDIDINIQDPNPKPLIHTESLTESGSKKQRQRRLKADWEVRGPIIELLRSIMRVMKKSGGPVPHYAELALVDAKVPIVHARHLATNVEIQIQSTIDGFTSMELVKSYLNEFPTLRQLFLVLRQTLKMRGLGDPTNHGIGSYPLIIMIVAALKFSSGRFDHTDAGRHLLYFLDFYSRMDFTTNGIAVDPPELFLKKPSSSEQSKLDGSSPSLLSALDDDSQVILSSRNAIINSSIMEVRPYLMCLQDPANTYNNLGRQAIGIKHVQATFQELRSNMQKSMDGYNAGATDPSLSLLYPCLEADYSKFEKQRRSLQYCGAKLTKGPVVARYL